MKSFVYHLTGIAYCWDIRNLAVNLTCIRSRVDNIEHDTEKKIKYEQKICHDTKNNMNTIYIYEYVKIVWIKKIRSKFIYHFKHDTT